MKHTVVPFLGLAVASALAFACSESAPKPRPSAGSPVAQPSLPAGGGTGTNTQLRGGAPQTTGNPSGGQQTSEPLAGDPNGAGAPGASPGTTTQPPVVAPAATKGSTAVVPAPVTVAVDPNAPKVVTAKATTFLVGTGTEANKYCTLLKNAKLTLKGAPVPNPSSGGQVIIDFQATPDCVVNGANLTHATAIKSEFDGW